MTVTGKAWLYEYDQQVYA